MSDSTLLLERRAGIAWLTLNRPEKLNALSTREIQELDQAVRTLEPDPDVRGIILTGAGTRAFAAGADIAELAQQAPLEAKARSLAGQAVFRRLEALRKPVVAAVNGLCLGGGCELAMACHLRVASDSAKFGQPEVKLGIGPGYGGTVRLPRLVGRGRALELLLTGETIDAQEAWRIGLVNRVVPADRLLAEAERLLSLILDNGPLAVGLVLEAVDAGSEMSPAQASLLEANHFGMASATQDMREGMLAFLEKRKPRFTGR
jgi:enoyl-CoA hydratase